VTGSLTDPTQHAFWILSRSLGTVAMLLISISVGLGLGLSARLGRAPGSAARLKTLHEAVSLAAMGAIVGHGLALLGDSYLQPGIAGIALPFALQVNTLWTGMGIIAGWLALVIGLSFYVRRWIGTGTWRWLHGWTILVYALGLVHTLGSGTDAQSAWLIAMISLTAAPVAYIGAIRLLPGARLQPRR
jgi:methionine sulfoxide reductase heme-binding subunit